MNTVAVGFPNGFWVFGGRWSGDPAADLLMGLTSLAIHDQEFGGGITGRRWKLYRPYVEDNWRVTKSLTLNLGLAWAMVTPIAKWAIARRTSIPPLGQFLVAGQNAGPAPASRWIGPRSSRASGAAWKPFGNSNTVVRGGYAIFHDSSWNQGAQGLWQNPPYYAESDQFSETQAPAMCARDFLRHSPRRPTRPISPAPSGRKTRISSRAEFSSSTSTWSSSCRDRSC